MSYNDPKYLSSGFSEFTETPAWVRVKAVRHLKTWLVGPTGTYASLPTALANANVLAGDRLLLESGYVVDASTPIVINKDITIEGAGAAKTAVVNVNGTPANLFDLRTGNNVYLKNLAFTAHSSGNCLGSSTSGTANLYVTSCSFSGPSKIYDSGNNIQFRSTTFEKTDSDLTRIPLQIVSSGNNGAGKTLSVYGCSFKDFSENLSPAIQVEVGASVARSLVVDSCVYSVNPHDSLLRVVITSSANSNVKIPIAVEDNDISTGNKLIELVGSTAASPLLLENFPGILIKSNTLTNTSGYGYVTCTRASAPAPVDLGSSPVMLAFGNTVTNPSTIAVGYAVGTYDSSIVGLTYDSAKFNAFSQVEGGSGAAYWITPPAPGGQFMSFDGVSIASDTSEQGLVICDFNSDFQGLFFYKDGYALTKPRITLPTYGYLSSDGIEYASTCWNNVTTPPTKIIERDWFGGGGSGSTTISSTITLTEDKYYKDLTITATGVLRPAGCRIYVSGTLTINPGGSISMDGASGITPNGGAGVSNTGSLSISSGSGGLGGLGGPSPISPSGGGSPVNVTPYFVGVTSTTFEGGKGSTGTGAGANGGTVPSATTSLGGFESPLDLQAGYAVKSGNPFNGGAGGGGGGYGSGSGNDGGGGGAGGGGVWIAARRIVNNGKITANGGDGGPGTGTGGGGGGGGGGWVVLLYAQGTPGFITAKAGSPGAGGVASTAAVDGKVYLKLV